MRLLWGKGWGGDGVVVVGWQDDTNSFLNARGLGACLSWHWMLMKLCSPKCKPAGSLVFRKYFQVCELEKTSDLTTTRVFSLFLPKTYQYCISFQIVFLKGILTVKFRDCLAFHILYVLLICICIFIGIIIVARHVCLLDIQRNILLQDFFTRLKNVKWILL